MYRLLAAVLGIIKRKSSHETAAFFTMGMSLHFTWAASPSKRKLSGISGGGLLRNIQLAWKVLF